VKRSDSMYILDFMKSTNDIKLESTLLPYDSFWCSVLMIICSPWYCLFIEMIYRISKLDNMREKALIMYTYNCNDFNLQIQPAVEPSSKLIHIPR
jgi:hypothetical protein